MLAVVDHFSYELQCPIQPTDTELMLNANAVKRLNEVPVGDHVYLTLSVYDKYEIVKFTKQNELTGGKITVERDVERKGAKNFPRHSCVKHEWSKRVMDEYLAQVAR